MTKIALIYPPYQTSFTTYEPGIKAVKSNYGIIPCLSLLYVAGILKREGYDIKFYDIEAMGLTQKKLKDLISEFNPDYYCFTMTTYLFHETVNWIRILKSFRDIPVIVGGVHVGIYPRETFTVEEIDYGVIGEAEETLPELIKAIKEGTDLAAVKGIIFRKNNNVVVTSQRGLLKDINNAPFPARDLIPNERYYTFISKRRNFSSIISSRGCPFKCIYCEQGRLLYRPRSAENVIDEIKECYYKYNIKEFDFFDSAFTIQKERVNKICELIREEKLDIYWSIRSRIDSVDEAMLSELAASGCKRIYYGIESGDSDILRTLKKDTDLDKIRKVSMLTKKKGIDVFGYFLIGCPGETPATIEKTINFSKELDLEYAQFSNTTPMPRTELYDMLLKENNNNDYWRGFILDKDTSKKLKKPGTSLSEKQVKQAIRRAYMEFYFRPRYILKIIGKIESFKELLRYAKAAFDMVIKK